MPISRQNTVVYADILLSWREVRTAYFGRERWTPASRIQFVTEMLIAGHDGNEFGKRRTNGQKVVWDAYCNAGRIDC